MNKLIQFTLRNRLLMLVLGALIMGAGYYSYTTLPVDAFPDVSPSLVQVFTVTEGLAPQEVEQYVTYPIEAAMNGLPDVERIRSISNFGLSVVNIYFKDGTDIYFARQLVNERLQEVRAEIPEGFGTPQLGPISTGMGLILFYYLDDTTGKYSLTELRTIQDWLIKYHLQTVPGVTEVLGIGGFEKQFHVNVDPEALLKYNLTINEIIERIEANNLNVGAQFLEKNDEEFIVRSVGLATGVNDLRNIVIKTVDGTPIYLHDVADVRIGGAIRRGVQTRNGLGEVVAGMVIKLYGSNASTVIGRVEQRLAEINKMLPEGVRIVPYYEQKTLVQAAVHTVTSALIQGILLVILVLVAFLGSWRPSVVVALSIPFSVLFATLGMKHFGISANLMSLGGLAIAIGMMVDGTIVMIENVDRLLRTADPDEPRLHVIARACMEVARPIVFAISIIVIVFLPLFTLQGVEGKTFRPLAYTTAMAMFGSLLFALLLAPTLSSLLMKRPRKERTRPPLAERILTRMMEAYRPVVTYFVHHRKKAVMLAAGLLVVGASVFPFLGSEFTPTLQEGTMVLRLTMAPSISLEAAKEMALRVERKVMQIPEVTGTVTRIGRGEVGAHTDPINSAEMYILLKPRDEWRVDTQEELEVLIRQSLGEIPGVLTNFTQPIQMTVDELLEGVRAELAIKLFGEDLQTLKEKADEIAAVVQRVRGAADVQPDQIAGKPQLRIRVDREAIARYGLNVEDVQRTVRAAIGGEEAGQIFEGVRRFDIYVRYTPEHRTTVEDVRNLLIPSPENERLRIPLEEVALIEEIVGPRQITRENNQRFITIQANVVGRDIGTFVQEAQQAIDAQVDLPPGYYVTWGGQFRLQQEANKRLMVVIPITLLLIFILLYSSFNSLKNSLLILLNIPLALVGGIVALALTGQNLSVPASVGFIALFGIALENGMVLVTYLNKLVRDGIPIDEASIEGALLRLRPVLMTALTTSLGLIPLLATGTGSEVQRPLATVVIGGLVTSTILTLLVLPALYKWFAIEPEAL
ncbi:efflux RND transporter permease subunit [Rhodothermus marinus]|uniref:efflux RND transporter permease subunit n=1 Tax=Rhodothermus marinus TaxID=29549 RepID=UPI0012BA3DCD|nr:CusA/CzcA family heavy metal efflux RND transporter [Rhodothermus marinus]BBM71635.1 cytochrome-c peroxidase [Rhodothermus marinus]